MQIPVEHVNKATRHLGRSDPVMRELIRKVGPFELRLERNRFWMLARSIISQQVSTAASRAIRGRVRALFAQVTVQQDTVVLQGRVRTFYHKQMAQEFTKRVAGVRHVRNLIEVADNPLAGEEPSAVQQACASY